MDTPLRPLRAAVYARVSTEEQREGQTIASQIAQLEQYAKLRGWPITNIYKDEGWTGSLLARPDLDKLRDDAANGLFDAVLVNDVDRLARDVSFLGVIKRDLERKKVQLIFRNLPNEGSPTYNLMVNILGSFAEFERAMIADRTRRGMRHKAEVRKQFVGCLAPYGYSYTKLGSGTADAGRLVVNDTQALVVKSIFNWIDVEKLSLRRVLKRLSELRISSPKGCAQWNVSTLKKLLRNETYAGVWHFYKNESCEPQASSSTRVYRKTAKTSSRMRARADWIPVALSGELRLIERDQWLRVQGRFAENARFSPRNTNHMFLLSGLIRCGACGKTFTGKTVRKRIFKYRCNGGCGQVPAVREEDIFSPVWECVKRVLDDPRSIEQHHNETLAQLGFIEQTAAQPIDPEKMRIEIRDEEERVLTAYRSKVLTVEQLSQQLETLAKKRSAVPEKQAPTTRWSYKDIAQVCSAIKQRLNSANRRLQREVLREVVKEIVFDGKQAVVKGVLTFAGAGNCVAGAGKAETQLPLKFEARIAVPRSRCHVATKRL